MSPRVDIVTEQSTKLTAFEPQTAPFVDSPGLCGFQFGGKVTPESSPDDAIS